MKKYIVTFILGMIVATTITVSATILYQANEIGFTPADNNWNVNNLESALNDLYTAKNNNTYNYGLPLNYTLYNGVKVMQDENEDYYLYFDGVDDYVQLETLPSTINWEDGFTIEFTAKWDAINSWSRIFDFAANNRADTILVGNYNSQNQLIFSYFATTSSVTNTVVNTNLSEKADYKIIIEKGDTSTYVISTYKNEQLLNTNMTNAVIRNVERMNNFLGKSNASGDQYFKGRIYKLKIDQADGTNIINFDVNRMVQ